MKATGMDATARLVMMEPEGRMTASVLTANTQLEARVVAFATSAGGLHALTEIFSMLPADFDAACIVLQHLSPNHISLLPGLLQKHSAMTVTEARGGSSLKTGMVYVGPPGKHMVVWPDGKLRLTHTKEKHFSRPSADVLFESLATVYKQRVITVILTGKGGDGAEGIQHIKAGGGIVLAQDETTAEFFGMPGAAIRTGYVDYVLPLLEIAPKLIALTTDGGIRSGI